MRPDPHHHLTRSPVLPQVELRHAWHTEVCYHTHTHDEFSVGVIDAGSARCHNGHRRFDLSAGMTVMMNPGDPHACNPRTGQPWSYRMLFIDAAWVAQWQASVPGLLPSGDWAPFSQISHTGTASYQAFDGLFHALAQADGHPPDPLDAEERLAGFLWDHCFAQAQPAPTPAAPCARLQMQQPLQRTREFILDQLADTLTLDALAQASGLNRYHLIRSFKQAYGQTPHAFQLDQRINHAKRLLRQGQALADVAHALGFADQSHFQRHFKKRHALTPKAYQQGCRV